MKCIYLIKFQKLETVILFKICTLLPCRIILPKKYAINFNIDRGCSK